MVNNQQIILDIEAKVQSAKAATSLRELKQITRELQAEALKYQNVNEEAFTAAQVAAGQLTDQMKDLRAQTLAVAGEPIENIQSGFSLIKSSIAGLDFGQATTGVKLLATNIKNVDFSKIREGIGGLMSSFKELGSALLTNPLFLLGSAILLIITNFDKLKEAGGAVGAVFKTIGFIIESLVKTFTLLTDTIGLTDSKAKDLEQSLKNVGKAQQDINDAARQGAIDLQKALGEPTVLVEYYQKQVDALDKLNQEVINFETKYGLQIKSLMEIPVEFDKVTGGIGALPKKIADFNAKLTAEQSTEFTNLYTSFRKQIITISNFIETQNADINNKTTESTKDAILQKNKIITQGRNKEIADTKFSAEQEMKIEKKRYKFAIDMTKQTKQARDLFYQGELKALEERAIASEIDNDTYVKLVKETNEKRFNESAKYDKQIKQLESDQSSVLISIQTKRAQDIKNINLKNDIEILNAKKINLQESTNLALESLEYQYEDQKRFGNRTTAELFQLQKERAKGEYDIKLQNIVELNKLDEERLKKELELYKGDAAKVSIIKSQLAALESKLILDKGNLQLKYLDDVKAIDEKEIESAERVAREKERIAREQAEIRKNTILQATDAFQQQADMDQSELNRLNLGFEKYKDNSEEKISIIKDMGMNQAMVLKGQMDAELSAVDLSEEQKQNIREKYADKQKTLAAQTADAIVNVEKERTDKQVQMMQYMSDSFNSIGNLLDAADDARRDANGKLDVETQRKAFNRNKQLQFGAAIMNTAAGITNALSTQNYAGAIAIGIAGAAQALKILNTRFQPESDSSTSGGSSTSTTSVQAPSMAVAPSAPLMSQSYLNMINPNAYGFKGMQRSAGGGDLRVWVAESDITGIQTKVKVNESRSTLSGYITR